MKENVEPFAKLDDATLTAPGYGVDFVGADQNQSKTDSWKNNQTNVGGVI